MRPSAPTVQAHVVVLFCRQGIHIFPPKTMPVDHIQLVDHMGDNKPTSGQLLVVVSEDLPSVVNIHA